MVHSLCAEGAYLQRGGAGCSGPRGKRSGGRRSWRRRHQAARGPRWPGQIGWVSHADPIPAGRPGDIAFGFAKSTQANISKADLDLLREAAAEALEWSGKELDRLVASGTLVEIEDGNDDEG